MSEVIDTCSGETAFLRRADEPVRAEFLQDEAEVSEMVLVRLGVYDNVVQVDLREAVEVSVQYAS